MKFNVTAFNPREHARLLTIVLTTLLVLNLVFFAFFVFPKIRAARIYGQERDEILRVHKDAEKTLAAMGRYEPTPAQFSTWLYTIARNAVIDYYRRRRLPMQDGAEDELYQSPDPAGDPEALLLADERRRRLHEAILELTDEQRQVVGCRFYFNLSIHEVARATGKTEGAVKALQFRALQRLHRSLAPDWSLS